MISVSAFTAKRLFTQLLWRAERGEEIAITRYGKAVARLVPAAANPGAKCAMAVFRRLRKRATGAGLCRFEWVEWRAYRDQGRP
jgi:prevent-host-death family protein